jgi:predicted nuclease of restriction endonuclease-like (RecB) superfamily
VADDGRKEVSVANNNDYFDEIITIIETAKERAARIVNRGFIDMYWDIGEYISKKVVQGGWGKSVVKEFSEYVQGRYLGITGFSAQNIWRMKQFYEAYSGNEKLSPLVREISWSNNLVILSRTKTNEAREFYLRLCAGHLYSKRELERQVDSALFERAMTSDGKNELFLRRSPGLAALRDSYVLEFIDVPERHKEKQLRKAILANLRDFILEFGKDFTLVGDEYRVQVGNTDFKIDLLFYNRELSCLVAIELKVTSFKPEHLGQLEFYLEALDRDVRKPNENPSVGLILCADKDDAVVEYALSRSMSPALVADYQLRLPKKALLENKLRELAELAALSEEEFEDE